MNQEDMIVAQNIINQIIDIGEQNVECPMEIEELIYVPNELSKYLLVEGR